MHEAKLNPSGKEPEQILQEVADVFDYSDVKSFLQVGAHAHWIGSVHHVWQLWAGLIKYDNIWKMFNGGLLNLIGLTTYFTYFFKYHIVI